MTTYLELYILFIISMYIAEFIFRKLFHKESFFKRLTHSLSDASETLIVFVVFAFVALSMLYFSQYLTLKIMAGI